MDKNIWKRTGSIFGSGEQRQTKLLLNVSVHNSLGPIQVVMSPENTVGQLIKAVMDVYMKERRRPLLGSNDPKHYELHFSQFSLESLKPEEKLMELGSRNFFLRQKSGYAVDSNDFNQVK